MERNAQRHFRLRPSSLAVVFAIAATTSQAQAFDPASSQVLQAYDSPLSAEKLEAARVGLTGMLQQAALFPALLPNPPTYGSFTQSTVSITSSTQNGWFPGFSFFFGPTHQAGSDADLSPLGNPVRLSDALLMATASFSTGRNFAIGPGPAYIDTAGHELTITGVVTASAPLHKSGSGTLTLTGDNVWAAAPVVGMGTLRGNSRSLQTAIENVATVDFDQGFDGSYQHSIDGSGGLRKSGAGTLTLTADNPYRGPTVVAQGRLALQGMGALSGGSSLDVHAGAVFDLTDVAGDRALGALTGTGDIVLGKHNLTATSWQDSTFDGTISGPGQLAKAGGGTLTLTGDNSYTGGSGVFNGRLALAGGGRLAAGGVVKVEDVFDISAADGDREVGSIEGGSNGRVELGSNALTFGRDNQDRLFAGSVVGSGALTKVGTGTLFLTGFTTHSGVTNIEQGSVAARTYSLGPRIVNNGTLLLTQERDEANPGGSTLPPGSLYTEYPEIRDYSGTISGSGQLIKAGNGVVWLRGENSYSGGTRIDDGVLLGNDRSLPGDVVNNAGLAFYQASDGTYSGSVSGSGLLLKYGPGNLTLTGINSHGGGTVFSGRLSIADDRSLGAPGSNVVIAGGTLRLRGDVTSARAFGLASAGGSFDTNGHTLILGGMIDGPGTLTKTGAGTLELAGTASPGGATNVAAGTLKVSGSLHSAVTVAPGATLTGSGQVASVVAHGRVAPGNPTGTLTVSGDVALLAGSALHATVDAQGNSSHLAANSASLQDTTLAVTAQDGRYPLRSRYALLTTTSGLSGRFTSVTSNLPFLQPQLDYDTHNVYLQLLRNQTDYSSVVQTATQAAVAGALGRVANSSGSDAAQLISTVDGLTAAQARAAFDSIAGVGRVATARALHYGQRALGQQTFSRLGIAEAGERNGSEVALNSVKLALAASVVSDALPAYAQAMYSPTLLAEQPATQQGWWLRGYGGRGHFAGSDGASDAAFSFAGLLVGYDQQVSETLRMGLLASYATPELDQDTPDISSTVHSGQIGLYGRYRSAAWRVDALASAGTNESQTKRVVTVGNLQRVARGDYDGQGAAVQLEVGYALRPAIDVEIEPYAGLQWSQQRDDSYSESGADALNLNLAAQNSDSLRSLLGVRGARAFDFGGSRAMVDGRIAWAHEFGDNGWVGTQLAGDPSGTYFRVPTVEVATDSLILGLGLSAEASRKLRLYLDWTGEYSRGQPINAIALGLRYNW